MDLAAGIEHLQKRSTANPLEALNVEVDKQAKEVSLSYHPTTSRSFFDVCDLFGKVIHTHVFNGASSTRWSFADLKPGRYNLIVVDGTNIKRQTFTI